MAKVVGLPTYVGVVAAAAHFQGRTHAVFGVAYQSHQQCLEKPDAVLGECELALRPVVHDSHAVDVVRHSVLGCGVETREGGGFRRPPVER